MTLVEFILARLAEDQATAFRASTRLPGSSERRGIALEAESRRQPEVLDANWDGERWVAVRDEPLSTNPGVELSPPIWTRRWEVAATPDPGTARHIVRHDPARVLADVEGTRRIVAEYQALAAECQGEPEPAAVLAWVERVVLPSLALRYSSHPDYQESWRPDAT